MNTITGKIIDTKRHGHTVYGNPMVSVMFDTMPGAWHRVSNDAGIVYGIENSEYRDESHTFELTKAGRLSGRIIR